MSTLTPVPSTPGLEDDAETDRKPKREPKQEHVPPEIPNDLSDLLASLRPLTIQPPPLTLEIERKFLRLAYGGSDQQLVQIIPAARNPGVGIRRIVFPKLTLNPLMPTSPGAPGLLFTSRHDVLDNPPWTLFCKRHSGNAVWLYLGEYESELIGQFTLEQFAVQSSEVKDSWVRLILTKKRQVCYASMRARIALRAAGLIPLEDDGREQELIDEEVKKVKAGKGRDITEDQIMQAFTNGDEAVDIIRMKCVRYDRDFADDIKRRYAGYPEMLKAEEAAKENKKASGTKLTSKSRRNGKKRKSNTTGGSDREDPESEGEEEGDDYDPAAARTTQGKRKKSPTKASSSKSTRTISGSAASASPCPQRASRPPVIDAADSVDDADDIYATDPEEAAGDAVPEDHGVWKPHSHSMRSSPPSTSGRPPSQRTRKPSQKISDSAKATEH